MICHEHTVGQQWQDDMELADGTQEADELDELHYADETDSHTLYEHQRYVADAGQQPLRVDKFLATQMRGSSRARIQAAAETGHIFVCTAADQAQGRTGQPVKSNYRVRPGDIVTLMLERPKRDWHIEAQDIPLDVVYEDDVLLVVNKPAGMVVHPGCGNFDGTLVNALAWHLRDDPRYDPDSPEVGLCHRIDKDTSGLLVVAKTPEAKSCLGRQFYDHSSRRTYNALVWGRFADDRGTITGNIGRDVRDRQRMAVYPMDGPVGKPAVTHYRVMESFGYTTLVESRLETGRTHQIRAHMKHIGHPLFADERYGGTQVLRGERTAAYRAFIANCFALCPRQALHARTLGFSHPASGQQMDFCSPLPADMQSLIDKWRRYVGSQDTL